MDAKLKHQVLAEWRGLPIPAPKPQRTQKVGKILEKLLPALGLSERLDEATILKTWHTLVGDFFACHARPISLKAGVLHIQVLQPSIRYELDCVWKYKLLTKFQEKFGKKMVREIRF